MKKHGCLSFLLIVLGLLALFLLWDRSTPEHPWFAQFNPDQYPLVIAHADDTGSGLWPGNTLLFLEGVAALGVDVLEMDAHMSADGHIVLMHDDEVDRTTNGSGLVNELTLAELKTLEVGGNWTPDDGVTHPYEGLGLRVPTLVEVFDLFPDYPMVIEIKQESPSMVEPLCDLLRAYGRTEQVLVPAFDDATIQAFRTACPEVATAAASDETRAFVIANFLQATNALGIPYQAFQVPQVSDGVPIVIAPFVSTAHDRGLQVHVWTINDPADMTRLVEMGVDGIMTDRPDLLLEMLGR